ncbi:hypothetical protein [Caballeronia sp. INDeC2]|uniref:hypothetical protein n=1 Tax=Caballeronia sp. INDeC2 TaxID=2921747 RepID=UPI002027AB50|nr:hypothetical protein [Caballeronia sp. INDeC2]
MIKSKWTYETSAGGNAGLGPISFSGGMFVLSDPAAHKFKFSYHTSGMGLGLGQRLPARFRLPETKLPPFISRDGTVAGTGATNDFTGRGAIFRPSDKELEPGDFVGLTLSLEASIGVLVAGGATVFLTGLQQSMVVAWLFNPGLFTNLLFSSATALVIVLGMSEGLIDGLGVSPMLGSISYDGP